MRGEWALSREVPGQVWCLRRAVSRPRWVWSSTTLRSRTAAGVTSTHSSSRQNSSACSSESLRGGISFSVSSAGGRAHVGELLLLGDVHVHVVGAGVLADDHAFVDLGGGLDEEGAALLQVHHRERGGGAGPVGDERAAGAGAQLAEPRLVRLEDVVQDAGAAGVGEELGPEPDQRPGRHQPLHPDPAGAVVDELLHPALAGGEQLGDDAEVLLRARRWSGARPARTTRPSISRVTTCGLPTVSS